VRTTRLPYFHSSERIAVLRSTLATWAGTHWRHAGTRPNSMHCGVSGDCLFWVHVFKAIGALPENIEVPRYRRQEALSDSMLTLRTRIEATGRAELILDFGLGISDSPQSTIKNLKSKIAIGDVLLFKNGMSGAHCGLVVRSHPVHFAHLSQNGFTEEPLNQKHWLDSLVFVYRLLETSPSNGTGVRADSVNPKSAIQNRQSQ